MAAVADVASALPYEFVAMVLGSAFRPPVVGLDIGSSSVKAVVLKHGRNGWSLVAAGESPVPDGGMQDGAAAEPTAVSEAVNQVFDSIRVRRARVAAALSGHAVIVKRLSLPTMSQAELSEAIPWEAEQYIPFDLAEVQLDYQVVNTQIDPNKSTLDVLLVAAKKDRIEDRSSVIMQTGRRPVVIDIEAFALANAYQMNYPERTDPFSALIHVGRSVTIVCLLERGEPVFTRDISIGGQVHLDGLVRELGPQGVDDLTGKRILHGQLPNDVNQDTVSTVLRDASTQLVMEIRKTIDFYRATAPIDRLSRIVLSGGAWQAAGLVDMLASEFGAPVDVFDPFRRVTKPTRGIGADTVGPAYAVAVGLAMRAEGDR
jgi:type IV pilus assembly protein PilM